MARFQMLGDWPGPGNVFVEAGTIIDGNDPQWIGIVMPLNARALDAEALARLCASYHPDLHSQIQFSPGLRLPDPNQPAPQRKESEPTEVDANDHGPATEQRLATAILEDNRNG